MAVLGRLLISSAERLDLPDFLSIDSYTQGDFKYLMRSFVGSDRPYILTGFDIINPGAAIGTQNVSIKVADSVVYYPGSLAGPFFHGLEEGNALAAPLVPELRKNSTNYVYVTLSTTEAAQDTRAFWDPDKEGGEGGEFTQDVNTQTALVATVNVSTSSFPENTVPVAIVEVGPNFITSIEDARDMMFRLGSGGLNPDPLATYAFRDSPSSTYARLEPNTQMTNALDPNAFQGGDKNILSLKEWMDVVMTKLKELGGTTYWYEDTSSFNSINIFKDALATSIKSKGVWQSSDGTPGLLTWTEDILVQTVSDSKDRIVRAGNKVLADNQTMYMPLVRREDINSGGVSVNWFNGLNYINGTLGAFENLSKGDWIKKSDDPDYRYLRVEEFYAAANLAGGVTAPGNALSIKLSDTYGGISELKPGVYDKGIYLSSEVEVADRNDPALTDLGGDLYWLAMRSDTIISVADLTTTTLSIDISNHDGSTAKCTSVAHGLADGQRIGISGTTNFDGTYAVEVEDVDTFYINISGGPFADEAGQSAYYATITTQARSTVDGLQLESANHEFNTDQTIQVSDTTNYNGSYKVFSTGNTTFTIPVTSAIANETSGLATAVTVYVRTDIGPTKLDQGENKQIGETDTENLMSFIGMDTATQTHPTYHTAPDYNTIDGFVNYNGEITDNLTQRVSKLTAMMADKAQDKTIVFAPSGYQSISNSLNGTAREISFNPQPASTPRLDIAMPSSANNGEVILTGSFLLEVNQAAYIQVDRNDAFSIASLAGVTVADISQVPLEENVYIIAVRLSTDDVWMWDGFPVSPGVAPIPSFLDLIVQQDRNMKVVKGGVWNWDLVTDTLTWDADAYVQIPGITEDRNTIQAGNIVLAADGDVAYVDVQRSAGAPTNLTVNTDAIDSMASNTNRLIIARRVGDDILVGNGTFLLKDGEYLELDGALAEINRFFSQLQLDAQNPNTTVVEISISDQTRLDTRVLGQELAGLLMKFDGAKIDFSTGTITALDDSPLGQNFTPVTIASNQYRWYSVSLIPDTVDAQNRISAQVLVLPGSADGATPEAAPRAVFGGTKKIGQVVVQDDGAGGAGTILDIGRSNIVQLGVGAGSGGGSGAPKMIGGGTFSWDLDTTELSFTEDIFVEQARLDYADNTIDQATVSPLVLPTTDHVAFIERLNASSGGSDLTVIVDLITNVKDGQIIIARRDGDDVIVGSTSNRLRDGESAKLFAQRSSFTNQDVNLKLIDGGTWDWDLGAESLSFDAEAYIQVPGLTKLRNTIPTSESPISLGTDEIAYVDINRKADPNAGTQGTWTAQTTPAEFWTGVTYGNGLFVAVNNSSTGQRVATSPDGITWTSRTTPVDNNWTSVTYGNGLFVAVSASGTGDRVMTSPDGINWTSRVSAADNSWVSVTYGGELFVAVSLSGSGNRVMTSPDGINWTIQSSAADSAWTSVAYGGGLFVAVANGGANRIMTSPDGVVWTLRTDPALRLWEGVAYGNGKFVAVGRDTTGDETMTSPDGINWTLHAVTGLAAVDYREVTFGDGLFVAVATSGSAAQRAASSTDGITWTLTAAPNTDNRNSVAYGDGLFVAMTSGVSGGAMTSTWIPAISNLAVNVVTETTVLGDDSIVIARRVGDDVIVGNKSIRLIDGESKALDAGVSNQLLNVIPAANNADDSGQARLKAQPTPSTVVDVTSVTKLVPDGTEYGIQLRNLLLDFTGATIDFATGTVSTGLNFTPATIAANQYRWYSVTLLPGAVGIDGKIAGQLLVLAAESDGASASVAPRAAFANGIPLGQIVVQDDGAGGAGTILDIEQSNIVQLTTAGGSGAEGNADELIERLRNQLDLNNFQFVGFNIFRLDEDDKVDGTATGSFDIANGVYDLEAAEEMISTQMLDAMFLTPSQFPETADEDPRDVKEVELTVFWDPESVDDAATYEVSRMAGQVGTWQEVEMDRIGNTETFRGYHIFEDEGITDTVDEYDVANADSVTDLEGNGVNAIQKLGTPLTVANTAVITNVTLYTDKLGSPGGNLKVSIVRDDTSLPSTDPADVLAESNLYNITSIASGPSSIDVAIPAIALVPGTYHVVVSTDDAYKISYSNGVDELRLRVDASAPTGNDIEEFDGTTETWATNPGIGLCYTVEGRVLDLRVRITASQESSLAGYGIFYDGVSGLITGIKQKESFTFDGIVDNDNEFTLGWVPDPDLLRVYEIGTGQVYVHGAFTIDGTKVSFPVDTFNKVGDITLVFDQSHGTSFDNSDLNGALLAANRLGSTDPLLDKSVAGEGILLRADNGTLVEASIRWNGAAYEWIFSEVP